MFVLVGLSELKLLLSRSHFDEILILNGEIQEDNDLSNSSFGFQSCVCVYACLWF